MASHYLPRTNHKVSPGLGNTTQPDHRLLPGPVSPCFAEVSGGSKGIILLVLYKLAPVVTLTRALSPCSAHDGDNILCNLQPPLHNSSTLSASPCRSLVYGDGCNALMSSVQTRQEERQSAALSSSETVTPRSVFLSVK